MVALIDADILAYEFGAVKAEDGVSPLPWPLTQSRVDSRLWSIMQSCGDRTPDTRLFLTAPDQSNFRYRVAKIRPYKGNRHTPRPHWWERIRDFLIKHRGAEVVYGMEADDKCSIEQIKALHEGYDSTICSRDKDLNMVPGKHYIWPAGKQKEKRFTQSVIEGLRCFYRQLLTGDSVDNIPGLYGVGPKASCVNAVSGMDDELSLYGHVREEYRNRFGQRAASFLRENAALLWMLQEEPKYGVGNTCLGELEINERFDELEEQYKLQVETGRDDGIVPWEDKDFEDEEDTVVLRT